MPDTSILGGGSQSPPTASPGINSAAAANSGIASKMTDVGSGLVANAPTLSGAAAPVFNNAVGLAQNVGTNATGLSDSATTRYNATAPIEAKMNSDAMTWDSDANLDRAAQQAGSDNTATFTAAADANQRNLARSGINVASPRSSTEGLMTDLAGAASGAGAMNNARTARIQQAQALRAGAVGQGNADASVGLNADSTALNSTGAATAAATGGATLPGTVTNQALPWYTGAAGANSGAGNLLLGEFGTQTSAYNAQQQANATGMAGLGSFAGQLGAAYLKSGARKGGVIVEGLVARKGYAKGGIVRGPGDGTEDTVPALIDGKKPAALANGEAVLNAEATKLIGEDFVHKINRLGLDLVARANRSTEPPRRGVSDVNTAGAY